MDTTLTAQPDEEPEPATVFVLATTAQSTRHALSVARALGTDRHAAIDVVAPMAEKLTVSSARANVYDLAVDLGDAEEAAPPDVVRSLTAQHAPGARVITTPSLRSRALHTMLPPHATVVLSGPVRHFLESAEQRLARELTKAGHDVVFIPSLERETHR